MEIAELYRIYRQWPSVQTDTRKIQEGDIYFALGGPNFDGNTFAADALAKGAVYAVVDKAEYATSNKHILVDNVLTTLQQLARHHRQQFDIPFIAITGSNGKTTTKELLAAVLSRKYRTYYTAGNLNNHIGVPLTLLKIKDDAEMAIIEMGANHQREIASYCEIALPTHGIITNCGKAHIEGFGGIEGVRKGKGELYDFLRSANGTVFRNTDLDYLEGMSAGVMKQVTYGTQNAQYMGHPQMDGVFVSVVTGGTSPQVIKSHLVGEYNFPNILLAIAAGSHFGVSIEQVKEALDAYQPDNSRSQWVTRGSNQLILDAYNANPTSMKAAIQNFAGLNLNNKLVWLGGMKEMGTEEYNEHKALVELVDSYAWGGVILVGKEFEPVKGAHQWFATSAEAADHIKTHTPVNSAILVKGSRGSKMELLAEVLPA